MKTKILLIAISFLFVFNTNYAVNVVKSETNNLNTLTIKANEDLALNKSEKKLNNKSVEKLKALKLVSKLKKLTGGDINTLVLVILSLFPVLCLIAVYIKDGGITLNFWVDLLLHLTVLGEIIFALLVVLDIFSLA